MIVLISLQSLGPSDIFAYLLINMSALIDVKIKSWISLLVGQISFKKTGLPSFAFPKGSLYKSMFIDPAKAYATTNGGEAR